MNEQVDPDEVRNREMLRYFGFRVPVDGIPDELQKCALMECDDPPLRTQFLEVTQPGPYDGMVMRLWVCDEHGRAIEAATKPKPVAIQFFFPRLHMDSIPKEAREQARQYIARHIDLYVEEHGYKRVGEVEWEHQFGRAPTGDGGFIEGTLYTGTQRVDRS